MADRTPLRRRGAHLAFDGVAAALERLPRKKPTLAVLTYHRVAPADDRPDLHPGLRVDPVTFAEQMDLVATRAHPVGIDEVLAAADGGTALPARAVHITFDDAYSCIATHAWPVLRRHRIPATTFVPTRYPDEDRTFWWDRLHHAIDRATGPVVVDHRARSLATPADRRATFALVRAAVASRPHDEAMALVDDIEGQAAAQAGPVEPRPATSTWAELRSMAEEGLALGAHSRHHPFLDRIDPDRLDEEIAGSLADLHLLAGDAARPVLAYPGGGLDAAVVTATTRAGIRLGFTTQRGVADLADPDWLRLPRINVGSRATRPVVRIQLQPMPHRVRDLTASMRSLRRRSQPLPDHPHATGSTPWN